MGVRLAAGFIAVAAGIASALAPVETSAGSGSIAPGRGFAAGGAIHAPLAGLHNPHLVRPFKGRFGRFARFHNRQDFGFPLWWTLPSYGDYGGFYGPSAGYYPPADDYESSYQVPRAYPPLNYFPTPTPPAPKEVLVLPFRPGCATETVEVPSEGGSNQTVNIVRC